jgi:hypothetical protein
LGDIMLAGFSQDLAVRQAAGVVVQTSIHLWLDQHLTAFKFTFRLTGQPWWAATRAMRRIATRLRRRHGRSRL